MESHNCGFLYIIKMKFSVLLSIYYRENPIFLRRSLDSILGQSLLPDEIVLVKDGRLSKALDEIINLYVNQNTGLFKIVDLLENQGLGKALNEGLKFCSYDIIARMDTDDIAKPHRFEKQIAIFDVYSDVDIVSSWIEEFDGDISNISSIRKLPELHEDIYKFAKKRCPINHPVSMFRKSAVLAAGGYKHFPLFEDYYLWVRMLMNDSTFYNIQESLLYFRLSPEMFQRRGGFKYAMNEIKLQKEFLKMGFIGYWEMYQNVIIRFISRLIPNRLRVFVYMNLLR